MDSNKVSRYVKAGGAILSAFGITTISEDEASLIVAGFMTLYGIVSAIQAKFEKRAT